MRQRPSAHISKRSDFYDSPLDKRQIIIYAEQFLQRVIQRTQIRIHLFLKVSRKKSQLFTRLDGRPSKNDFIDLSGFKSSHGHSNRQIRFSRTGRTYAENERIFLDCGYIRALPKSAALYIFSFCRNGNGVGS